MNESIVRVSRPQGNFKSRNVNVVNGCDGCVAQNNKALCLSLPPCTFPMRIYVEDRSEAAEYKPTHGGYPEGPAMPLASDAARARNTDPQTSHDAAAAVGGGKLVDLILTVMQAEDVVPGWTGKELAARLNRPLNSITPRFAPMRRAGFIHPAGKRDKQIIWRVGNGVAA